MSETGAPQKEENVAKVNSKTPKRHPKHRFDFRWLIAGLAIVAAMVIAIVVNFTHTTNDSTKFTEAIEIDNGDLKINWDRYQTTDIVLSDSFTITESGTYHLTGNLSDGTITIDAGVGEVRLLLDNVAINSSDGPAIACLSAEDLVIELIGTNIISDGANYSSSYDEDVTGAIYSKSDLTFQGDGELELTSNYQDGIVGKDDLKFNGGTYNITAEDDAIRGKDSVYIVAGNFIINSVADAIKTTNTDDLGKGFVLIEDGNFNITSTAKGLKSVKNILVYGGNFVIDSYDDAIHSDNYIGIIGGNFNITSGDDAVHANSELIIDGGKITVAKAYEGLEAQKVTINNGDISIVSSDDGLNAGGGKDNSTAANNRPGADAFDSDENCILSINGGNVYINASGDGIDSNGWIYFNGGTTIVDGPTDNGNSALDTGIGIVINGGQVLALGSSGMAETLGSSSSVFNASIYLSSTQSNGTNVKIQNSAGETILEHTTAKSFSHIAVGSPAFQLGQTYTLYLGEDSQTFTISSITTTVGDTNSNFHNFRK